MKKKMMFAVCLVLLAVFCCLGAEAESSGKRKADPPWVFQDDITIYYYDGEFQHYSSIYYSLSLNNEDVTDYQIDVLKGDPEYIKALSFETFGDESNQIMLGFQPPEAPYEGISEDAFYAMPIPEGRYRIARERAAEAEETAVYHILLTSEHYYAKFDCTCTFKRITTDDLSVKGRIIRFPLGKEISFRNWKQYGLLSDPNGYVQNVTFRSSTYEHKTDDYEYEWDKIIFHNPGYYAFYLEADLGVSFAEIPVVAYAGEEVKSVSVSGDPISFNESDAEALLKSIQGTTGTSGAPKPSSSEKSERTETDSEAAEKVKYDGETLLKAFFGVPDTGVSLDDLPVPKKLSFLDKSFLGNDADREEETGKRASSKISSDELEELRDKQYKNAASTPELQERVSTEAFQAENTWMDTHFVYTYPVPEGLTLDVKASRSRRYSNALVWDYHYSDESGRNWMDVHIVMYKADHYTASDVDNFRQTYQNMFANVTKLTDQEIMGEDGIPRWLVSFNQPSIDEKTLLVSAIRDVAFLYRHDNCSYINIEYCMQSGPGKVFTKDPIDLAPFEALAAGVAYEAPDDRRAAQLPDWLITEKDFNFHVNTKPETRFLMSGQTVKIMPGYQKSNLQTYIKDLAGFSLLAVDTEQLNQGNSVPIDPSVATLDEKGVLTAGEISAPTSVSVITTSGHTGESQTMEFVLLPGIESLELSEQKVELYAGDSAPMKLQGILTPSIAWVYPEGGESNLVWTSSKSDVLSVTDNRDTTATIEALAPGKATVTLTEAASKKKATASVTVLQPVTELSIDGPDTIAAGRGAGYKAVIGPKNAGNKKVQWSIDVDESIASVKSNGQLKIVKGVPSGTVITLTCTAEGAAAPRIATKTVTVE